MKNFVQNGKVIAHTAAANIASGDLVVMGTLTGVAVTDIASGESGSVQLEGVFTLPKDATISMAQGDKVYWVTASSHLNKTASANTFTGYVTKAALAADTTVEVLLAN